MRRTLPIVAVLTVGALVVGAHAWLHPPARDLVVDGAPLALQIGKLGTLLQSLATLFAIDLAALAIGTPLWRRLHPTAQPVAESLPSRLAVGLLALAYAVLLLAALHVLVEPALAALVAVPILAAAPSALRALRARRAGPRVRPCGVLLALAAAVVVVGLGPLLDAFVPRYGWDALVYHLAVPERYLWAHKIWFTPFSLYSAFPLDVEMLYAVGLGLGGAAVAKLINLQFGVLALWALALLGRRVSPRAAVFAVAVVLADPLFAWELGVAYTDLAGALYALLAFAALVDVLDATPPLPPRACLRLALFGGACVAIRLPALLVPAALTALLVVAGRRAGPRALARAVALVGAGVAALIAPWLVRTAAFTGNPLAPAVPSRAPYFDGVVVEQMLALSRTIGVGHSLRAIVTLPWTLFVASTPGVYSGGFGFDVGPLYLVAVVAALLAADARRLPLARRALAAGGLCALGWFVTSQEARYLLPALVLFALAGGIAFDALAARARWPVAALALAAVVITQAPRIASLPARYAIALGAVSPDDFAAREDAERVADELRATLPPEARVLVLLDPRAYYFRGLDFIPYHQLEGSPVLRLVHDAADPHALRCQLAALGVTHVVVNLELARRFHPVPIAGYGAAEYTADLARLRRLLDDWAEPITHAGGVVAAHLRSINDCTGVSSPGAALPTQRRDPVVSL